MNLWLRYPLSKAVRFLESLNGDGRTKREYAHVLCIGPWAFMFVWQEEAPDDAR